MIADDNSHYELNLMSFFHLVDDFAYQPKSAVSSISVYYDVVNVQPCFNFSDEIIK